MKYMFLMYGAETNWNEAEREACMVESLAICDELKAAGKFIATAPLQSVTTAATVRVRDGRTLITDGPFAETTEQLGGFFVLDLADLDEAITVASRLPSVKHGKGAAEIRPMYDLEGVPPSKDIPAGSSTAIPYLLVSYDNEAAWQAVGPAAHEAAKVEAAALCQRLNKSGTFITASPLHPAATATCVRLQNGKRQITDGPFTETHEVVGGFYVILAESREAALNIALQHPGVKLGAVEVRPLFDVSGLQKTNS